MIVTRKQAQAMWCPFGRLDMGHNRALDASPGDLHEAACRCMADRCMAWRWQSVPADGDERKGLCGIPQPPGPPGA